MYVLCVKHLEMNIQINFLLRGCNSLFLNNNNNNVDGLYHIKITKNSSG